MAGRITEEFGELEERVVKVELQPGALHSFDVLLDNTLIFSKFTEGRFPEKEEIINAITEYLNSEQRVETSGQ